MTDPREAASDYLRQLVRRGDIDLVTFEDALGRVLASGGTAEIEAVLDELTPAGFAPPHRAADEAVDVGGGHAKTELTGTWNVPRRLRVLEGFGRTTIDLRRARFAHRELNIHVETGWGRVILIVPSGVSVDFSGSTSGRIAGARANPDPDAPRITITIEPRNGRFDLRRSRRRFRSAQYVN